MFAFASIEHGIKEVLHCIENFIFQCMSKELAWKVVCVYHKELYKLNQTIYCWKVDVDITQDEYPRRC